MCVRSCTRAPQCVSGPSCVPSRCMSATPHVPYNVYQALHVCPTMCGHYMCALTMFVRRSTCALQCMSGPAHVTTQFVSGIARWPHNVCQALHVGPTMCVISCTCALQYVSGHAGGPHNVRSCTWAPQCVSCHALGPTICVRSCTCAPQCVSGPARGPHNLVYMRHSF